MEPTRGWPFRAEQQTGDQRRAQYIGYGARVQIEPHQNFPNTWLTITLPDGSTFREYLMYSHHAFGKMVSEYEFDSVLEIGSRNGAAARGFEFIGKKVITCDLTDTLAPQTHTGDYLELVHSQKVDAIWCSHVLEHQRYMAKFIEKMFDDLRDGGILALTVPAATSPLMLGHCNTFTAGHLLYQLVLAGFDCSQASVRVYDWQLSVVVRKVPNNLPRVSIATVERDPEMSIGVDRNIRRYFPSHFRDNFSAEGHVWGEVDILNW